MIAFACAVGEEEPFRRYAEPGIRLAREADSPLIIRSAVGSAGRSLNLLLEAACELDELEALVIVHPYAEIADRSFCVKVREALADPEVAVVGCAGARGGSGPAWWEGETVCGSVRLSYNEHGGGELPWLAWRASQPAPAPVDVIDEFVMVLSPWAIANARFDEGLFLKHGHEVDFCRRVRQAGGRVAVADLEVAEHRSLELVSDLEVWAEAHIALARKWDEHLSDTPGPEDDAYWKARARRAEGEREAARAIAYTERLKADARVAELEREFEAATGTFAWRLTRPLREANRWRRERDRAA